MNKIIKKSSSENIPTETYLKHKELAKQTIIIKGAKLNPDIIVSERGSSSKKLDINKNKYKNRIDYNYNHNVPVFKIFSDFFNIIYQDIEKQKKYKIEIIGLIENVFQDSIVLWISLGTRDIMLKFFGLNLKMTFNVFRNSGELYYDINLSSAEKTDYKSQYIYDQLFALALKESELAGSYLVMPNGDFRWEIKNLEKRAMTDIYLPIKQMEDIEMFVDVYNDNAELLRYLLVGVPGTGKTESCLTLMNELNKKGVTIIKTPICKYLDEKVQLAVLLKPSIIILDDLDLSLGSRNSGGYSSMLQSFLDILDGTDKLPKDVGILATTNSAFLLDLAAQRPGRFDKVMIFDELTKDNIYKIILKSLKFNFDLTDDKTVKIFSDSKIVDKFHKSQVTGAHIYNSISMMKLKSDTIVKNKNKDFKISVNWLLDEIEAEIKILDKIKNQQKIEDRLNNNSGGGRIGFTFGEDIS